MKTIQPKTWRLWAAEVITALLIVFFVHSAIDNFLNLLSLKNLLWFYTRNVEFTAWLLVIIEAVIAVLLFFPATRLAGLVLSFLFLLSLIIVVLRNPHAPHFFGGILNYLSKKIYLPFGITLIFITLIAITLKKRNLTKDIIAQ